MIIKEDSQLYKGIFWVKDPDDIEGSLLPFQIPCDMNGFPLDDFSDFNSKSGTSYNHEKTWRDLPNEVTNNNPYNYYPRGRIEISNGRAIIYCSPYLASKDLIDMLKREFNLTAHNGITSINLVADGSNHYKCYLDE